MGKPSIFFDFTHPVATQWSEVSDTVRPAGLSKATWGSVTSTEGGTYFVLFTLLNPQPNGAGFAGISARVSWNLSSASVLGFKARSLGNPFYGIVLKDPSCQDDYFQAQLKTVPDDSEEGDYSHYHVNLSEFERFYQGSPITGPSLQRANITEFGIRMIGGVYQSFKQEGVSSLQLKSVWAE